MCLNLMKYARAKYAQKDIICYKSLFKIIVFSDKVQELNGKAIELTVNGRLTLRCVLKGQLYVNASNVVFILHNCEEFIRYPNRLNDGKFKYMWRINGCAELTPELERYAVMQYLTPYRGFVVTIGETYTSDLVRIDHSIETGIHSFVSTNKSISWAGDAKVECIIPAGSKYYVGLFNEMPSYASDKLKYVKIIK